MNRQSLWLGGQTVATESWWVDLPREQFVPRAYVEAERMRANKEYFQVGLLALDKWSSPMPGATARLNLERGY